MVVTVGREKVISHVEESQDAANSPHINGLSEREAETNLWGSKKMETSAKDVEIIKAAITFLKENAFLFFNWEYYECFQVFVTEKGHLFILSCRTPLTETLDPI